MRERLALMAAGLWWGSLTAIGFVAVPLLFRHLPSPQIAGNMAGHLFTAQSWLSVVCGLVLLILRPKHTGALSGRSGAALIFIVLGMLLALLIEFAVAPHIRARDHLALWHGTGTAMYAVQWLCAGTLLWRQGRVISG